MMNVLRIVAAVIAPALMAGEALACRCMSPQESVIDVLRDGGVVALGAPEILPPRRPGPEGRPAGVDPMRYRFSVQKAFGAALPQAILVQTPATSAACGVKLTPGESVVLYLRPASPGAYAIDLCGQLLIDAQAEDWRVLFDAVPD